MAKDESSSTMEGTFPAKHNHEVTALITKKLGHRLVLIGYREDDGAADGATDEEVWGKYIMRSSNPKFQPKILGNKEDDKWKEVGWATITKFVDWINRIPDKPAPGRKEAAVHNWLATFPEEAPQVDQTPSLVQFTPKLKRKSSPKPEITSKPPKKLKGRSMAAMIETKQHPGFTHPGRKKEFINMTPLAARIISSMPGYEDYFEEMDFGQFGTHLSKLVLKDPDSFLSAEWKENERVKQLAIKGWAQQIAIQGGKEGHRVE